MSAAYIYAGGFSLINAALERALRGELAERNQGVLDAVDAGRESLARHPVLKSWLWWRAAWFFRDLVAGQRIPPGDLLVRLPEFSRHLKPWLETRVENWKWTLQTQTLFDANTERVPHFIYTDHTYRANWRYHPPRKTWRVYPGWEEMERKAYTDARMIFVSSQFAADSLVEDYGIEDGRVRVVGSGSNIEPPVEIGPRGGGRILFVGVEWERKGGPWLLEAFERLREKHPGVELDVVGCAGEHPTARFHGRVSPEEVREFYARADIFCLPSLAEPSASVLAEAAAFGLPIVGTRVGGTPERVVEGETGWLVPPGDAGTLGDALEKLLTNPETARQMGDRGRERMLRHFTWSAVARKICCGIEECL